MSYVPGTRTPLALDSAPLFCGGALRDNLCGIETVPRAWWIVIGAALALDCLVRIFGRCSCQSSNPPSFLGPVLGAVIVGLGFVALVVQRKVAWIAAIAAGYCMLSFALINPLYQGIALLGSTPVAGAELGPKAIHPGSRIAVVGGSLTDQVEVRGSDAELISGMTMYPNRDLMEKLAPTQEADWNNFQHYLWLEDLSVDAVKLERLQLTRPNSTPIHVAVGQGNWDRLVHQQGSDEGEVPARGGHNGHRHQQASVVPVPGLAV